MELPLHLFPKSHAMVGQESPSLWGTEVFCLYVLVKLLRALKSFSLAQLDSSVFTGKPHAFESTAAVAGEIQERPPPCSFASPQQDMLLAQQ